jgi:hypothetical protein
MFIKHLYAPYLLASFYSHFPAAIRHLLIMTQAQ